jgi:hypothetical protein
MKALAALRWSPKWVSHLGCIKGCLDYLGIEMTDAWLYGGSGHAFIINISQDSCASGPTAWKTMMLFEQAPALGYRIEGVFGSKYEHKLTEIQKRAWEFTRESVDQGFPVYGWELEAPEFYVIYGYDDDGYYYSGPGAEIGIVELYKLSPVEPQTAQEVVKSAFEKVLKHAGNPDEWIFENYGAGLQGYDNWIKGLESGAANRFGMGYNAAVWHECRKFAVEFLVEARDRLAGKANDLFDQAIQQYGVVADRLGSLSERYPFIPESSPKTIPVDNACLEAVSWLKEAREAESRGLSLLARLAEGL